jgi:carbamoyl-phosphate synthase large subunit
MINCNPETVSTDYDTSDRLYFEPLTAEDVLEILHVEQQNGTLVGVIVQFGGQTPLKLAQALSDAGIPILGTSPDAIDLAEDRERFAALVNKLGLKQPENGIARSREEAIAVATRIGYPVLTRPSYVLGGRAMEIVDDQAQLENYIETAVQVSGDSPVLIDRYLRDAIEVDVDALCDGVDVVVAGVLQHIEEAGVHSGDSACSIPPYSLSADIIAEIERQTEALGARARSARADEYPVRGQGRRSLSDRGQSARQPHRALRREGGGLADRQDRGARDGGREARRPAQDQPRHQACRGEGSRLPLRALPRHRSGAQSPEMKSTGEVMGIDSNFNLAFAKAQLGAGDRLPTDGRVFVSVKDSDKPRILGAVRQLTGWGWKVIATGGTADYLAAEGIQIERVNKVAEGRPHIVDRIKDGDVQLIFNTTEGWQSLQDSQSIRASALAADIAYYTTAAASDAATQAIGALRSHSLEVKPLQDYY